MFSFLKNKPFLKRAASLTFVLFLSVGLMFVSCSADESDSGNLDGTWSYINAGNPQYNYDIIINTSAKTILYTGSPTYEGIIANAPNGYTASSGVLIIQFTKYAGYGEGAPSATHANVGKFGALYWTDLTATSIKAADAYNQTTYTHVMFPTVAEANAAFTPAADKVGTYVGWSGIAPLVKK